MNERSMAILAVSEHRVNNYCLIIVVIHQIPFNKKATLTELSLIDRFKTVELAFAETLGYFKEAVLIAAQIE